MFHKVLLVDDISFIYSVNDLIPYLYTTVLSNYSDNDSIYPASNDKEKTFEKSKKVKQYFQKTFKTIIDWYQKNYIILNRVKSYYICVSK